MSPSDNHRKSKNTRANKMQKTKSRNDETKRRIVRVRFSDPARSRVNYDIEIGAGILCEAGIVARRVLSPHARRIAVISNKRVFDLYGACITESLRAANFDVSHWLMGDGERFKNLRTAERALKFLSQAKIERSDAVVALGGGVVGDLAGFAAALHLRGVDFIQIPTTLLAQIDSSVGGKTGVNSVHGKNLIGAFHQPRAVLIDTHTLDTLPARELTAGWCEAIKQGAIGDEKLFHTTRRFLSDCGLKERSARRNSSLFSNPQSAIRNPQLISLIAAQCAFKARIVAEDEREDITRTDAKSRRILNFGHTIAHALEKVTNYRRFRHGEAVGYGILAAAEIAKLLTIFGDIELQLLRESVRLAGQLPRADDLDIEIIISALQSDKKSVGGNLQWILPERIGHARIVDGREVAPHIIRTALRTALLQK